jgi:hypothetical protein
MSNPLPQTEHEKIDELARRIYEREGQPEGQAEGSEGGIFLSVRSGSQFPHAVLTSCSIQRNYDPPF